jgi:Cu/Ag efflux protein CusF
MSTQRFVTLLALSFAALASSHFSLADPASAAPSNSSPAAASSNDDTAKRYPFRGVIIGVYPEKGTLLIKHEDVPGLMKGMTMAFRVDRDVFELKFVKEHQAITATLIAREDDLWLENLHPAAAK